MTQLTFQACIFSGVVCSECGAAFDNVDMKPAKLMQHRRQKHHDMELDARSELNRVKDILKDAATCLAAYSTDNEKAQCCEIFLARRNAVWCSHGSCNRAYMDEQTHSGNNRTQHREDGHFSNRLMKCPVLPKSNFFFPPRMSGILYRTSPNFQKSGLGVLLHYRK